jgi:cell division protein FtsI (penicillin-binding protein 3)
LPGPVDRFWRWLTGLGHPASRQTLVRVVLVVALVVFAGRLVQLQVLEAPALAAKGQNQRMVKTVQPAERGQIIAADGTVLASDVARYEIQANPKVIAAEDESGKAKGPGAAKLAEQLAPRLGLDQAETADKLADTGVTWVPLVKHATQDQWDKVSELIASYTAKGIDPGIYGSKHYVRLYPAGTLAGNLVGYQYETEESDGTKLYTGLEQVLSDKLAGKAGSTETEVGGNQQPIPGGKVIADPAEKGCDATLTINSALQFEAQQLIQAQVEKTKARAGMVIAIDIPTGEILILADSDPTSPAEPSGQTTDYQNSRALENVFEPGSTGKVVTMAMLLEEGFARPDDRYTVPYEVTLGGQSFHDSSPHGTEQLTLAGVLAKSSNVGTLLAAQATPDQLRYDYLKKFGFGERTGVEFTELEATGRVHKPGDAPGADGAYWDGRTAYNVLFGQGLTVNALQATEVFATIGNGGIHQTPHLVKGWTCPGGGFEAVVPSAGERVVSQETADQLVTMMEQAVGAGTGQSAQVEGYRTAGKTGTSQMFEDGDQIMVGSFAGVLPAEAPRIAVGVFIIAPAADYYGAIVAGPVFKEVAASAVDHLGVAPSTTEPSVMPLVW